MNIFFKGLLTIIILLYSIEGYSQSKILSEKLKTFEGKILSKDSLKKGVWVVLISTYECGYCMQDIKFNNALLEKYKGRIGVFSLFENDSAKIVFLEKKNNIKLNWTLIPDAENIYEKYSKSGGFPEVHIYNNGKLIRRIPNLTDENKNKMLMLVDNLLEKNKKNS